MAKAVTMGWSALLLSASVAAAQSPKAAGPQAPSTTVDAGASRADAEEQALIEAAKRHPIAHPEPRPLYPEKRPPPRPEPAPPTSAPPPNVPPRSDREPAAPTSPPPGAEGQSPAATTQESETRTIAPQAPPPMPEEERPQPPDADDVWAPGYWYWYDDRYMWVPGGWLAPRPGYVYVGARWTFGAGGWAFVAGGWSLGYGGVVVYPDYRHRYYYPYYGYAPHPYWYGRSYGYWPHDSYYRGYPRGRSDYYGSPRARGYESAPRYAPNRSQPGGRTWVVPRSGGGGGGSRTSVRPRR